MLNVNLPFNHGHAGTLGAGVHGKDRAGDRYRAIRSANIQMPRLTMRGLHDDAALVEMDGSVAAVRADSELSALIHFHFRAVEEPHRGMGVCGCANEFSLRDFITLLQCAFATPVNA